MSTIRAWATNDRAQLAGAFYGPPEPLVTCVALPSNTVQVGGSYMGFTGALLDDLTMRMLGGGVNGEMGQGGHRGSYYLPVEPHIKGIAAFACAGAHVVVLTREGTVAGWGGNSFGTLGNGVSGHGQEEGGSAEPVPVPGVAGVKQVATGNGIVACLFNDGTVVTWGDGSCGALGIGRTIPTSSSEGASPHLVPGLTGVKALACGGFQASNHVIALMDDGTVRQWGARGPCGTAHDLLSPTPVEGLENIVAVEAGAGQSFAIDDEGHLFAWGALGQIGGSTGQLFLPPGIGQQRTPVKVRAGVSAVGCGLQFSVCLHVDGSVEGAGRNDRGQLPPEGLTGIEGISVGEHHAFAIGGTPTENVLRSRKAPGGLMIEWRSPQTEHRWEVTPSVLGSKQGKTVALSPEARSMLVPATPGQTMAVKVRSGAAWPTRTAVAVA